MGNMTGWIVAGILVAALLLFVVFFVFAPPPSAPYNTAQPGFMEFKAPETPLTSILPALPSAPGNAAEDYAKAVTFYKRHRGDIDATGDAWAGGSYSIAVEANDPWANPNFKICRDLADMVAAGAKKAEMNYTFVFTPQKLKLPFQVKYTRDLYQISLGPFQCYQLHFDRKEYAQAEKRLQDMLVLGWHMMSERKVADMNIQGIDIMMATVDYLQKLYKAWPDGPRGRLQAVREYGYELSSIRENWMQKRRLLWDSIPLPVPGGTDNFYPGDVFNMVENEGDKAWKAQAILCLGPMKFRCVNHRGDTNRTRQLIRKYLNSDDPILKAAAEYSDAMTVEDYQNLGRVPDEFLE